MILTGALALGACSGAAPEGPAPAVPIAVSVAASAASPATPATPAGSLPVAAPESGSPASHTAPPRGAASADASNAAYAELARAVGRAACSDDAQCRTLALGSKPCGGPEGYMAWSVAATDARQIEALALRYQQARQARNQRLGLVSDCAMVPEPAVRCVPAAGSAAAGGQCRTLPGRAGPTLLTR